MESVLGFVDLALDLRIWPWICGFGLGFVDLDVDLWIYRWICGFAVGFVDILWICGFVFVFPVDLDFGFGFAATLYEIWRSVGPLVSAASMH